MIKHSDVDQLVYGALGPWVYLSGDRDDATTAVMKALEAWFEDYRAGIDQAAEHGSEAATRDSNALNRLEERLFPNS